MEEQGFCQRRRSIIVILNPSNQTCLKHVIWAEQRQTCDGSDHTSPPAVRRIWVQPAGHSLNRSETGRSISGPTVPQPVCLRPLHTNTHVIPAFALFNAHTSQTLDCFLHFTPAGAVLYVAPGLQTHIHCCLSLLCQNTCVSTYTEVSG